MNSNTTLKDPIEPFFMGNVSLKYVDIDDTENVHRLRTNYEVGKYLKRSLDQPFEEMQRFVEDRMRIDAFVIIRTIDTNELV